MSRSNSKIKEGTFIYNIIKNKAFYLMMLPGILFFLIFRYLPMYGLQIAFKDYMPWHGFRGSEWVGLSHFQYFFSTSVFRNLLTNTIGISMLKIIIAFPITVIFALLLNELKFKKLVKLSQTVTYMPYFMSWVIIYGVFYFFFNEHQGVFINITQALGFEPIRMVGNAKMLWPVLIFSTIWRTTGWGTIVFLAAISGIDQELYNAAEVDGAGRFQKMFYITIPSILPTVAIMALLRLGGILNEDFEQILMFVGDNSLMQMSADVFETYTYRISINGGGQYSYAAAIGLFQSFVGFFLVVGANHLAKVKLRYRGLF